MIFWKKKKIKKIWKHLPTKIKSFFGTRSTCSVCSAAVNFSGGTGFACVGPLVSVVVGLSVRSPGSALLGSSTPVRKKGIYKGIYKKGIFWGVRVKKGLSQGSDPEGRCGRSFLPNLSHFSPFSNSGRNGFT